MSGFIIKPAKTRAELDGKAYVHYTAWNECYTGLIPQKYLDSRSLEQCRSRAVRGGGTLVAIENGEVVGFACSVNMCREFVSVKPSCEITGLYVLEKAQKRGIGSALMARSLSGLPQDLPVVLFVLDKNRKAIEFYQKRGFRFTGHSITEEVPGGSIRELEMIYMR